MKHTLFSEHRLVHFVPGDVPQEKPQVPTERTPELLRDELTQRRGELEKRIKRASELACTLSVDDAKTWNDALNRGVREINEELVRNQADALKAIEKWTAAVDGLLNVQEREAIRHTENLARLHLRKLGNIYYVEVPYGPCGCVDARVEGAASSYTSYAMQQSENGWLWPIGVNPGESVTVSVRNRNGCESRVSLHGRYERFDVKGIDPVKDPFENPGSPKEYGASDAKQREKLTPAMEEKAREEMQRRGLPEKEISFRLKILRNANKGRAYFPDPAKKLPEIRNPAFWTENAAGSYVPRLDIRPTDAIKDLWVSTNGIQCNKYTALIMIKSVIDAAEERGDEDKLKELNALLRGKAIPNELPDYGYETFFTEIEPKESYVFEESELLPGDQIWFWNPYFDQLTGRQQNDERYRGEQGSNVFYLGDGKVCNIYDGNVQTIEQHQSEMLRWVSVIERDKSRFPVAVKDDFEILSVRRPITGWDEKRLSA